MKVIKKGRPQKGWSNEHSCTGAGNQGGGCQALLLVDEKDLFVTRSHLYDGSSEIYITFKCPECGVLTDIKDAPDRAYPTKKDWEVAVSKGLKHARKNKNDNRDGSDTSSRTGP
jgi:hypothetical protein